MRRGRLLILVFLLLLLGGAALLLLFLGPGLLGGQAQPTPVVATPTPEGVSIVIASQDIARGAVISADVLSLVPWSKEHYLPSVAIMDIAQVVGKIARVPIYREQPVLTTMLVTSLRDAAVVGSDAAVQIPSGMVAIAVPLDALSSAANAVEDGDRVDVIASFLIVDLDQDYQTILPNLSAPVLGPAPAGSLESIGVSIVAAVGPQGGVKGRAEPDTVGQTLYVVPSEPQRPRMVTQRLIQNALVLHVGPFTGEKPGLALPTPTPGAEPTATGTPAATPTVPPPREQARIMTLAVTPQDAVVLAWLLDHVSADSTQDNAAGLHLTYVLRPAGDTTLTDTETVTLQYMIDRFRVSLPAKLPYGLEPAPRVIVPAYVPTPTPPAPPAP